MPDGVTLVFLTNLSPPAFVVTTLDADPRTFPPLVANVLIPENLDVAIDNIVSFTFTGGEPPGEYLFFAILTPPGAFSDGRVDPGDLLAISAQPFSFNP